MSKLLYIQASPQGKLSYSIKVADAFLQAYQERRPGDKIERMNVFREGMPSFDGFIIAAKYKILHGLPHSPDEKKAWAAVERIIARFKSADKYLLAVPMWNFGIPYRLKQYLDIILQPGYTFSYDPEKGYSGLVTGKPVLAIYARGGDYSEGSAANAVDFQKRYMDVVLGFMGFTDIRSVIIQPTLMNGPDVAEQMAEAAIAKAKEILDSF
jgi:FMN-dependent NADH-azoreductase